MANDAGPSVPKTKKLPPKNPQVLKEIHQPSVNTAKTQAKLLEKAVNGKQMPKRIEYEDSQNDELPNKRRRLEEPIKPISPRKPSTPKKITTPKKLVLPDTPIPSKVLERLSRTPITQSPMGMKTPETVRKVGPKEGETINAPIIDITLCEFLNLNQSSVSA